MSTLAFLSIIVGAIFFVFILMHYWKYKEPEMDSIISAQNEKLQRDIDNPWGGWISDPPWAQENGVTDIQEARRIARAHYMQGGSHTHSVPPPREMTADAINARREGAPITNWSNRIARLSNIYDADLQDHYHNLMYSNFPRPEVLYGGREGVAPDEAIENRNNVSNITTTVHGSASMYIEPNPTLLGRDGRVVLINESGEHDLVGIGVLEFDLEPAREKKKEVIIEEPHKLKRKLDI